MWKRIRIELIALLGYGVLKALAWSVKWRFEGEDNLREFLSDPNAKIFAFWHESQLMLPAAFRRFSKLSSGEYPDIYVLISSHSDGRIIARIAERFGLKVVTGSSTRGGRQALLGMVKNLKAGSCVGITPDGPRGPRRKLKPGVLLLAEDLGAPVLPLAVGASNAWVFNSWDKMFLPKPFSTVVVALGKTMRADGVAREQFELLLENDLNLLHERAAHVVAPKSAGAPH